MKKLEEELKQNQPAQAGFFYNLFYNFWRREALTL